jgi:TPP-dependent pyruvate/acetoin dehydrogenase alpha subunit
VEAYLRADLREQLGKLKSSHAVEWFSLMPRKKKNKSATAKKHKDKGSRTKSQSARKSAAKKKKPEIEVLPVLNSDKLRELYATMVKCRLLAEHVQKNHSPGNKKRGRGVSGFEAALVGAGAHLQSKDCIVLEHSSFVASLIKGTPLHSILARSGEESGNGSGKFASSKQYGDAAVLSMETVLALAAEMKNKSAVVLMFCTLQPKMLIFDPVMMALAAAQKLPLVCLVESSVDARMDLPNQKSSGPYIAADASFYPMIPVDGCDAVAVFRVAQEAIRRAREGHGPAVIECLTSRSGSPANNAERTSTTYTARDPLTFMEEYLRRRDLWSEAWSRATAEAFDNELREALASIENPATVDGHFDNVYSADRPAARPAAASAR